MSSVGSSTRAHHMSGKPFARPMAKDRVRAVSYHYSPSRQRGAVVRPILVVWVGALVGVIAPQTLRTCTLPQAQAPTEVLLLILTPPLCRKQGGALSVLDWILLQHLRPGRRTANPTGRRPVLLLVLSFAFHLHGRRRNRMLPFLDWIPLKASC